MYPLIHMMIITIVNIFIAGEKLLAASSTLFLLFWNKRHRSWETGSTVTISYQKN